MRGNQFPSSNENINIQLRLSPLIFAFRAALSCGEMNWSRAIETGREALGAEARASRGLVATTLRAPAGAERASLNRINLSLNVAALSLRKLICKDNFFRGRKAGFGKFQLKIEQY